MFSGKKMTAVSVLAGGLAMACAGLAQAQTHAGKGPGACTRDLLGGFTCSQRIQGQLSEDGEIPHQETCTPVQPLTLPAALGQGQLQLGPKVTCSPTTTGATDEVESGQSPFGPQPQHQHG
ncbi:hypothetical protein ACWEDZ_02670 [Streptomyces sp. NPDC005047]|uniref:hypothetical protein n=1 Tax=unclassified Streptomyces TaxID=2593676 RepID=UPI00362E67D6